MQPDDTDMIARAPWRSRLARTAVLSVTLASMCQAQQAPVLGITAFNLPRVNEDATNSGIQLSSLISGYSDPDVSDPAGIAVVAADTTNGTWEYTPNNQASPVVWVPFGAVSDDHALLLSFATAAYAGSPLNTAIRFIPNANFDRSSSIVLHGWDETTNTPSDATPHYGNLTSPTGFAATTYTGGSSSYSAANATATVTINPIQDAPVLDASGNPNLNAVTYAASNDPGTSIAQLLATGANGNPITDPDTGALRGIAIIGTGGSSFGSWQYTLNGGSTWSAMPAIGGTQGFTLATGLDTYGSATDYRVRFVPSNPAFTGSISNAITFRAWDQSDANLSGALITPGPGGGATAYSIAAETASIQVTGSLPLVASAVSVPQLPVSGSGVTRYGAVCPSTPEGILSLKAALAGKSASEVRAFSWDGITQAFLEFPRQPTGGLTSSTGIFIATRSPLVVDFDGTPSALPFTITLHPGWNLIGIPPLDDGSATILTSHPWDNFQLLDDTATPITTLSLFVDSLGTPASGSLPTTRPWYWDGTRYSQVTTLVSGTGYWIKNNASSIRSIVRLIGSTAPGPRLTAGGSTVTRGTITDRGTPPALPASQTKTSSSCGAASGLGTFMLLLMAAVKQCFAARTDARPRRAD